MPKITIHLIRHAQGYHNLNTANHSLPDPSLTPLGEQQCATLASSFPNPDRITHLVSSPLRRTLYTTLFSFPSVVQRGVKVVALPELQEMSDLPCDTGSAREVLEREFKGTVDLQNVGESWNSKKGRWEPRTDMIGKRAREGRAWLRELANGAQREGMDEVQIVVVTHGGFLHYLTEDWVGCERFVGTGWANTECRSYGFRDGDGDGLLETKESRERRRGSEKVLGVDEQRELRAVAERGWGASGFQSQAEKVKEREEAKL